MVTEDPNYSHLISVGFVSAFPGLRKFLLYTSVILFVLGCGVFSLGIVSPPGSTSPSCSKDWWLTFSQVSPMYQYGLESVNQNGVSYVRDGVGYCVLKKDANPTARNGVWQYHWWEERTPVNAYGMNGSRPVPQLAPPHSGAGFRLVGLFLGGFGLALFFGLWVPATLLAMFTRQVVSNLQEE
jgi:hypothetical protein